MISARKSAPFNFVLRRWLDRTLRRRFHNVYVGGAEHLRSLPSDQPVVGCVNHTNWWDGFVLYVLSHRFLKHDIHLAMEEKNLRRYRFFAWMGVFGIDLATRATALPGMRYAVRLLRGRTGGVARLAWMFVQGELLPAGRAVEVKPGALFLARHAGAAVLPLVLRYEWLIESRPSIFVQVGAPLDPATTTDAELAAVLNHLFARIGETLSPLDLSAYEPLHRPGLSMNKRWDRVLHFFGRGREEFDAHNR